MGSLTDQEVHLFGQEFQKELVRLHETKQSQSYWARMIMPREKIQQIVDHLKGISPLAPGKECSWVESRQFKVFHKNVTGVNTDVLMEPTKEKGANKGSDSPRYLKVIPREEIFDTLLTIHLENNHSTLRETVHLVRKVASNIPRYLIHKFILLCPVCSNNGATTNSVGLPYTPSRRCQIKARRRRKLMDQFQVDILDLKNNPDGDYSYILHCMDHITGFHWLFPLAQVDAAEVAQNLVWGIFSLFGFPTELVSDHGKDFATHVIEEVIKLWPDELHIKNFLEGNSYKGDVSRRNHRYVTRFIDDMAAKKAALGDNRLKWSEWLPEIQFMLNATVLDVRTGKTPYEKVFRTQPITPVPRTKFVGGRIESIETPDHLNVGGEQMMQEEVTEEIVDHGDMAVMHHDMAAINGGVVVVDVGGVEHTIQTQHATSADVIATTTEMVQPHFQFETIETTEDIEAVPSSEAFEEVSDMPSSVNYHPSSKLDHLNLEATEVVETRDDPQNWVTLTSSGDMEESIHQVDIAEHSSERYTIEEVPCDTLIKEDEPSYSPVARNIIQLNSNATETVPVVRVGASQAIKLSSSSSKIKKRVVYSKRHAPAEHKLFPSAVRTRIVEKNNKDAKKGLKGVPHTSPIVINQIISKNTINKSEGEFEVDVPTGADIMDYEEDQYGVISDEDNDYYESSI